MKRFSIIGKMLFFLALVIDPRPSFAETTGHWKGSAYLNYGSVSVCDGWLNYDLIATGDKISGAFNLVVRNTTFEAKLNDDGSFDGSHVIPGGISLKIVGKAGEYFTLLVNEYGCGWKDIPLKQ